MEQALLTALQTKFPGVDAKILVRIAKKKAKTATAEDDANTIVDGITLQQIIDSHADYRATEAQSTAVKNYEQQHNIKDGKPIAGPEPQPAPGARTAQQGGADSGEMSQLLAEFKALRSEITSLKAERTANTRLEAFKQVIAAAPDKIKLRYERDFARLQFKDDADFNAYLEEIKPDIQAIAEEQASKGGAVGSPLGGGTASGQPSELVKARFAQPTTAATVSPAIAGLPTNPTA